MNEIINNLLTRRSVRSFKPEMIKQEEIDTIIKCAIKAPTAIFEQPWFFSIVKNKQIIDDIVSAFKDTALAMATEEIKKKYGDDNFHNFYHAPVVIFVSGKSTAKFKEGDCANATQNMCLAAHALGIGSCYIASYLPAFMGKNKDELINKLQIPQGYDPVFSVALGYIDVNETDEKMRNENCFKIIE